jgi:hypothetical protein
MGNVTRRLPDEITGSTYLPPNRDPRGPGTPPVHRTWISYLSQQ